VKRFQGDSQMPIAADDSGASHGGEHAVDALERALAAVAVDASRIGDLLDELSRARLWLPLPDDGAPAVEGTGVRLPTVRHLGADFVPAFTSAARLRGMVPRPRSPVPGIQAPPRVTPHIVVPAVALARLLPADVGIALNPGPGDSVAVYPEGVAYLAAAPGPGPAGA
jgi:SseB protein N-terminal domain